MDKSAKKILNERLKFPVIVVLIGVLVLIIGIVLPYISATGERAEYIEDHPDVIVIQEYDMTASDLKNISLMMLGKIAASAYGEDEGILFNVIIATIASFSILTALFVILKKPIAVMIFDLITYGIYSLLNLITKEAFLGVGYYTWGIGCYITMIAFAIILAGAILMLVKRIIAKKFTAESINQA